MTPLTLATTNARPRTVAVWLLALALTAGPLAGCLSDDTTPDTGPPEGMRVFLAALGEPGTAASARLGNVGIALNASTATTFLTLQTRVFDLTDLADSGQAPLAAVGEGLDGEAIRTVLVFDHLTIGSANLTNARLEVPFTYPAGADIEVTVTLDLDATAETGTPRLANLVVDRGDERIAQITGAELDLGEREEVAPLPRPVIRSEAVKGNDTAPSYLVNTPVRFSFELPGASPEVVREVFWSFSDGTTTTGREVDHTFRRAGPATVSVVVEGQRGQQARNATTLDIYFTLEGEGNIGLGTGGAGAADGRDIKNEPLELPGPLSSLALRFKQSPSGGLCEGGICAPSNLHIELLDPNGTSLATNTNGTAVKHINITASLPGGEYILRVRGDQGFGVGYSYYVETHYLQVEVDASGAGE